MRFWELGLTEVERATRKKWLLALGGLSAIAGAAALGTAIYHHNLLLRGSSSLLAMETSPAFPFFLKLLGALGLLFTAAGVGTSISWLTEHYLAVDNRFIAVAVYAIGMAVLTMVMGNAFAAFPIVTAGVGIPILVLQHGGNPAVMAAIGMFSGYCGTLMTPMAANFNIVPAALLELPDKNAVIKAQIPTGILLLIVNVFLLYFLMFL